MSLNYGNSTISIKNSIPVINWALFNSRANTDSATASEPAVGQCLFARYYSSLNAGTPSFLLIPSRFKSGKLYAQIPTNGSGDLDVTRSLDTATRVNASGLIESVASGIPRLDYFASGGTVGCPGLLVEPSGSNLALRSAELDNAVWTNALWGNWSNATAASSTTIAPDGSTSAKELTFTTGTSSRLQRITGIAASTTYTFSMYVMGKAGNSYQNGIFLRIATGFNNALVAAAAATGRVDLTVSNTIWTRYSVTFTTPSSGVNEFNVGITVANSGTNPNATMICWGAQLETGSVATSYIPTTTGTVTRNADVISVSGNVSGSIGQTEGSIYAEINIQKLLGTTQRAIVDIGQSGNRLFLGYGNGLTNQIRFLLQTSLGGLVDINSSATSTGTIKIAVGYKNNDSIMYVNGVSGTFVSNDSFTSSLNTLTGLSIGSSNIVGETHFLNDKINEISLFSTRLTNTALQNMTIQ